MLCGAFADDDAKIPSLEILSSVVGASKSSTQFKSTLTKYDFSENPKRDNSWGSSFGVFFELRDNRIQVGLRPPSDATNMPTYPGELPKGLEVGDSIEEILKKLGKPKRTEHDPQAYYEMSFEGITVYTMRGTLFEIWLIPAANNKAEQDGAGQAPTRAQSK